MPLSTLPQTKELEEIVIFEGLKGMLAFEKANKLPNAEFCAMVKAILPEFGV